jgi:hypothetical protein
MPTDDVTIVSYLPSDDVYATLTYDVASRAIVSMLLHNGAAEGTAYLAIWGTDDDPMDRLSLYAVPGMTAQTNVPAQRVMGDDGLGHPSPDPDQGSNINYEAGWPLAGA